MSTKKRFKISLLISFFVHSLLLFRLPHFQSFIQPKVIQPLEITYHKLEIEEKSQDKIISKSHLKIPPPFVDEDISEIKKQIIRKEPISIDKISFEKKITLPEIPHSDISNPAYLSYYKRVREKIRFYAYKNYTQAEEGEVYLSFSISSDGSLKRLGLKEEKSSKSQYLKRIALKSIRDASPFPSFPKELDFSELSFNIIISFEIE